MVLRITIPPSEWVNEKVFFFFRKCSASNDPQFSLTISLDKIVKLVRVISERWAPLTVSKYSSEVRVLFSSILRHWSLAILCTKKCISKSYINRCDQHDAGVSLHSDVHSSRWRLARRLMFFCRQCVRCTRGVRHSKIYESAINWH